LKHDQSIHGKEWETEIATRQAKESWVSDWPEIEIKAPVCRLLAEQKHSFVIVASRLR
jgi:hypothetical protein